MAGQRNSPRSHADQGASLVEAAFILPLLLFIVFGMITAGITLERQNAVKNAAREGSRFGAVRPTTVMSTYLNDVIDDVERSATGDLDDGVPDKVICVAFISSAGTISSLTDSGSGARVSGTARCFTETPALTATRVQVLARRTSDIEAIAYKRTVTLEAKSVSRYER